MKMNKKLDDHVKLLIIISSIAAIALVIFGIFRLLNSEYLQGSIDFFIATVAVFCAFISYKQNSTHISRWILLALSSFSLLFLAFFRGTDVLYWIYPILMGAYYVLKPKQTFYYNCLLIIASTGIAYLTIQWVDATAVFITMMVANFFAYALTRQNEMQQEKLEKLAHYDSLTGVRNRRSFDDSLREISESQKPASMIVFDIDYFKSINDEHGHTVGDKVLKEVGQLIENNIRVSDLLFRYGGEEFILLTRDNGADMPFKLAEKTRKIVERHSFSNNITLSLSAGVATLRPNESIEDWFRRADKLLYTAKERGRNQVITEATIEEEAVAQA